MYWIRAGNGLLRSERFSIQSSALCILTKAGNITGSVCPMVNNRGRLGLTGGADATNFQHQSIHYRFFFPSCIKNFKKIFFIF
jgi:hypothetical protein